MLRGSPFAPPLWKGFPALRRGLDEAFFDLVFACARASRALSASRSAWRWASLSCGLAATGGGGGAAAGGGVTATTGGGRAAPAAAALVALVTAPPIAL